METERDRVTPQLDRMSPLVSRTPPVVGSRSSTLGRQRRPSVRPPPPCVLVSAPILHRHIPLAIPTKKVGKREQQPNDGFTVVQVTSPADIGCEFWWSLTAGRW
jgi:hypothetical protein